MKSYQLDKYYFQFDFSDEDIKQLIISFRDNFSNLEVELENEVDTLKYQYDYLNKDEKNEINKLSKEYYENVILKKSLQDFSKIEAFLSNPINDDLKEIYYDIANDLNEIITIKRANFAGFEEIFRLIYDKISADKTRLKGKKRFISTFLHYMYFHCEIGKK